MYAIVHKGAGTGKARVTGYFYCFKKSIFPIMALIPILQRTQVNLPRSEFMAGKNLKKVIAAGEGRAQRNLEKLLDRRRGSSKRYPEKTGKRGFFL
jgi:hypothetical protein